MSSAGVRPARGPCPAALDPKKLLTEYVFAKCALAEVIGNAVLVPPG